MSKIASSKISRAVARHTQACQRCSRGLARGRDIFKRKVIAKGWLCHACAHRGLPIKSGTLDAFLPAGTIVVERVGLSCGHCGAPVAVGDKLLRVAGELACEGCWRRQRGVLGSWDRRA